MTNTELSPLEFDPYYGRYIYKLSAETPLRKGFETGHGNVLRFFNSIPQKKLSYRYESGKWSPKVPLLQNSEKR